MDHHSRRSSSQPMSQTQRNARCPSHKVRSQATLDWCSWTGEQLTCGNRAGAVVGARIRQPPGFHVGDTSPDYTSVICTLFHLCSTSNNVKLFGRGGVFLRSGKHGCLNCGLPLVDIDTTWNFLGCWLRNTFPRCNTSALTFRLLNLGDSDAKLDSFSLFIYFLVDMSKAMCVLFLEWKALAN